MVKDSLRVTEIMHISYILRPGWLIPMADWPSMFQFYFCFKHNILCGNVLEYNKEKNNRGLKKITQMLYKFYTMSVSVLIPVLL